MCSDRLTQKMSRIYIKSARCFPNECYICKSRENLRRCECNTISYCSEDHRQQHLSIHKDFCKVVKELLKIKGITHIFEELIHIYDPEWTTKREELHEEIIKKLGRSLSPLENFMFYNPRICFACHETKQEDLINCPHCPIASFCKKHEKNETHKEYCKVMNTYLNILTTAEKLNIDLDFLSFGYPFCSEEKDQYQDYLTITFAVQETEFEVEKFYKKSKLSKIDRIDFIDVASKINNVLQKTHDTIPEEVTIHIEALTYDHAITKENYWEFLLHLNPHIKKLKIVIITTQNRSNLETSLCQNCHSEGKDLNLEILAKSYDVFMLDENYQKPDILFYVKIVNECNSEKLNKWSEFSFPVVLRFESDSIFCETQHFVFSSTTKFRFIHEGQLKTPFSTLSSIENKDYFIILQSKENKVLEKSCVTVTDEICEEKSGTNTTETVLVENINSEILKCGNIADASKVTQSEPKDKPATSSTESNGNIQTNGIEIEKNPTNEEVENKNSSNLTVPEVHTSNAEQKSEDRRTISPSSSVCSFVIISEPGEVEKEKKEEEVEKNTTIENSKPEENNCLNSKSIDNESLETEDDEQKNNEKNNTELIEKRIEEGEEQKNDKDLRVNLGNFKNSQTNFSQSFLIDHISYLNNEIDELRKRLNASIEEVTKQQIKFEQVFSTVIEENKLMKKVLRDIVNNADIDSVLKNKS